MKSQTKFKDYLCGLLLFLTISGIDSANATELHIGTATTDITPALPCALQGQFGLRIARTVETPLTASVIALESREGSRSLDIAIMVSVDAPLLPGETIIRVQERVQKEIPGLDVKKIFFGATHTHTAPVIINSPAFSYKIPKDIHQPEEYHDYLIRQLAEAVVKAWNNREQGTVSWGLSHAAIAYNRRVVYSKPLPTPGYFSDGTTQMYGRTNIPEFINMEGIEDHDLNVLFFWNRKGRLTGMTINVPCPSQEVEGRLAINADFWHPVRERLKKRFGQDICVVGLCGAAGDQSPRPLYRKESEERMIKLRNLDRLEEIGRRIAVAVEEAYETVEQDRYADVRLVHRIENVVLPLRKINKEDYNYFKSEFEKYKSQIDADPKKAESLLARMTWNGDAVRRYEEQKKNPNGTFNEQIHVIRLGDVAICTNSFELFTDFGLRMQARSNALQTFVVQLVGPSACSYLPTEKAVLGGGYSAVVQSGNVGPEGGQILVDQTVTLINGMFPASK
jgi:hypothetical protein